MKCPLRFMGCEIDALKPPETRFICLKKECAWWDENTDLCSLIAEVRVLSAIGAVLGKLYDKMPHEEAP